MAVGGIVQSLVALVNKKVVRVALTAVAAAVAVLATKFPVLEGVVAVLAAVGIKPPHQD